MVDSEAMLRDLDQVDAAAPAGLRPPAELPGNRVITDEQELDLIGSGLPIIQGVSTAARGRAVGGGNHAGGRGWTGRQPQAADTRLCGCVGGAGCMARDACPARLAHRPKPQHAPPRAAGGVARGLLERAAAHGPGQAGARPAAPPHDCAGGHAAHRRAGPALQRPRAGARGAGVRPSALGGARGRGVACQAAPASHAQPRSAVAGGRAGNTPKDEADRPLGEAYTYIPFTVLGDYRSARIDPAGIRHMPWGCPPPPRTGRHASSTTPPHALLPPASPPASASPLLKRSCPHPPRPCAALQDGPGTQLAQPEAGQSGGAAHGRAAAQLDLGALPVRAFAARGRGRGGGRGGGWGG